MAANPHLKAASQALRAKHPNLNEWQMEPIYYRESLTWIREHPGDWIALMVKKVFYLVVPVGPSYRFAHSTRYYATSVISLGLLLPLAARRVQVAAAERLNHGRLTRLLGGGTLGSRVDEGTHRCRVGQPRGVHCRPPDRAPVLERRTRAARGASQGTNVRDG